MKISPLFQFNIQSQKSSTNSRQNLLSQEPRFDTVSFCSSSSYEPSLEFAKIGAPLFNFLKREDVDFDMKESVYAISELPYFNAAISELNQQEVDKMFTTYPNCGRYLLALFSGRVVASSPQDDRSRYFPSLKYIAMSNLDCESEQESLNLNKIIKTNPVANALLVSAEEVAQNWGNGYDVNSFHLKYNPQTDEVRTKVGILKEDNSPQFVLPASAYSNETIDFIKKQPDKTMRIFVNYS